MSRKVHAYLKRSLRWSSLHFTLIDPDKQPPEKSGAIAEAAAKAGSHAMLVGGSTGIHHDNLNQTVRAIKEHVQVPVILFPGGADGVSAHADAIFFMQMLNSQSPRFLLDEQIAATDRIRETGIEVLPMGYLVVAPGGRVGEVGQARLIPRENTHEAVRYALAAQYFGMDYVYLEAGSGAHNPVPAPMIEEVAKHVDLPLIVGGGIRDAATAKSLVVAGADIIVTGNLLEGPVDVQKTLTEIIQESIEALKKKIREAV
jgi:phosphoglycerol geranylgeranyltransferase